MRVELPFALERKYPQANREWSWQFVFPANQRSTDPRTKLKRRHHLHESRLQRAVKQAVGLAGISKPVGCHTFRHCFAIHLLESGWFQSAQLVTEWRQQPRETMAGLVALAAAVAALPARAYLSIDDGLIWAGMLALILWYHVPQIKSRSQGQLTR